MQEHVIVWDIETVPDLEAFAAASGLDGKSDSEIRSELGDKFPKLVFHKIVCIGALIACHSTDPWQVVAMGAPHIGERSEKDLIQSFVDKIAELRPQLVTFNGSSFDLPVLRYRAMVNRISAPGLAARSYFNRYTDDALDLCDALASFDRRAMVTLHELCRVLGDRDNAKVFQSRLLSARATLLSKLDRERAGLKARASDKAGATQGAPSPLTLDTRRSGEEGADAREC